MNKENKDQIRKLRSKEIKSLEEEEDIIIERLLKVFHQEEQWETNLFHPSWPFFFFFFFFVFLTFFFFKNLFFFFWK